MEDEMVEIELDLDEHTIELLKAEAKRTGLTVDKIVEMALQEMIDHYKEEEHRGL